MKTFLTLLITALSFLEAESESFFINEEVSNEHLIYKLINNEQYCVQGYESDKIFINPKKIILTSEGLILNLNPFESVPLPFLQSNRDGCLLEAGFYSYSKNKQTKGPCPNCEVDIDQYGKCTNRA